MTNNPSDFSDYFVAVNVCGGIPLAWVKLPQFPFTVTGDSAWVIMILLVKLFYRVFGSALLGWLFIAIYLIKDIAFLAKYNKKD